MRSGNSHPCPTFSQQPKNNSEDGILELNRVPFLETNKQKFATNVILDQIFWN